MWMWSRRAPRIAAVGQTQAMQVVVPAASGGVLQVLENTVNEFDHVDRNVSLIARVDIKTKLMEMDVLKSERERLQSMIQAESERLRLEQVRIDQASVEVENDELDRLSKIEGSREDALETIDEIRREISNLDQQRRETRLRLADTDSEQSILVLEVQSLRNQSERLGQQVRLRMSPPFKLSELDDQLQLKESMLDKALSVQDVLSKQLTTLNQDSKVVQTRLDQAIDRLKTVTMEYRVAIDKIEKTTRGQSKTFDLSASPDDQVHGHKAADPKSNDEFFDSASTLVTTNRTLLDQAVSLEPLIRALTVQDSKIQALSQIIADNEVIAPVSGMITKVHRPPGTWVASGEPIVTIAAEKSDWIIAYLSQSDMQSISKNDSVRVILRDRPLWGTAIVMSLGSQFELMPIHLRSDPNLPEFGLPVKISVPEELGLLPGELADLVFTP